MKKIKWHLLLIAAFGICAGYANKPHNFRNAKGPEMDTYQFLYYNTDHGRMYYGYDLTSMGWIQGLDYDCVYPPNTCTFIANPLLSHSDISGNWFYTSDVPTAGIDNDGSWESLY